LNFKLGIITGKPQWPRPGPGFIWNYHHLDSDENSCIGTAVVAEPESPPPACYTVTRGGELEGSGKGGAGRGPRRVSVGSGGGQGTACSWRGGAAVGVGEEAAGSACSDVGCGRGDVRAGAMILVY
jgi:hypothetical protein